ncbi:hypothetical protein [Paenibacillus elgii]|uniref:hypothetical protein n=1 Tax=Paenibacillus elgii TaxID=189691 RepID=UPI000248C565|nr:hypothetical protein [Paenibacillus elgii]
MSKNTIKLMGITLNFDTSGNPTQYRVSYQVYDENGATLASNAVLVLRIEDSVDLTEETNVKSYSTTLTEYFYQKVLQKEGIEE